MSSVLDGAQTSLRARHGWRIHLAGASSEGDVRRLLTGDSLPEMFSATARREPARPAVRIGGESATHGDLDARAGRVGAWLAEHGVRAGEVVIISARASVAMIVAYLGVLRAGALVLLANPTLTEPELAHLVLDSRAVAAVAEGDGLARLAALRARGVGAVRLLVSVSGEDGADATLQQAVEHPGSMDVAAIAPASPALLAYTSGTTGTPKAVPLSHLNVSSSIKAAMLAWCWRPDDVLVHALPLSHQHGLSGVHASLLSGSQTVVLERFDPEALWLAMAAARASVLFAVPAMYERLVEWAQAAAPDPRAHGDLRLAVSGSAPLSPALAERVRGVLGQLPLERYGTTESGLNVSNPYDGPRRPGAVGLPLPGVEMAVVDDDGVPVGDGADGEIVVRGPQVFSGYRGAPEVTAASFFGERWFRTGDVGRIDPTDGYLSITGRLKELIITGGMNVYPREVESALELAPGIAEAAVVGVPSQRWGEEVVAVVVPADEEGFDPDRILLDVRRRLSPYKCPKRIVAVASLPRNHMGKLVRRELAEVAAGSGPAPE
jgi:malonyl-CoA/methylmalonyl-CoA synthetase